MGSGEDSGPTEKHASSGTLSLEECPQGWVTSSGDVHEDNAEPDRPQGCTWRPCLIREEGCEGKCDASDFQEEKVEVNEIVVKDVQSTERENQRNVNEGSEEGEEIRRTVDNNLKCLGGKDSKVVGEPMDGQGCLETCMAGVNVDSYVCLAVSEAVEDSPSPMISKEFAEEQVNKPYASKIAENAHTQLHAVATGSSLHSKQNGHDTASCLLGGVLIGGEDGILGRETQLIECAVSREATIDDDFAGDLNEDCCPWSWWENSPDSFCRSVTVASIEENTSDEISASQSGEAPCVPDIVPLENGIVCYGSLRRLVESNGHGGFGSHDHLSPSDDSEKLLDGKSVNETVVCEGRIVEEIKDTEKPKGVGPCRPDPIDENGPGVMPKGSLKSGSICRSGRKTQAKRAAWSSRNASSKLQSQASPAFACNGVKKKRTYTSKAARTSVWGALNNISLLCEQLKGPVSEPIKNFKSKKSGVGRSGKKKRTSAKRKFQMSEKKSASFVTRIKLKVKIGKETIESSLNKEVVNTDLPAGLSVREGGKNFNKLCLPDSEPRNQFDCFDREGYKESFSFDGTSLVSGQSTEILKTNSFLDKSDGNVIRKYTEISNNLVAEAVLDSLLDPETSPDSEVINTAPVVQGVEWNGEGVGVADLSNSQDITVHENIIDVKGRKINAPFQGLLARQDGSLIMQKANENISGLESGLRSSSLDNPDYSLCPVKRERTSKGQFCSTKSAKCKQRNECSKKMDQKWSKEEVKDTKSMELKQDGPSEAGSVLVGGEEQIDSDTGAKYAAVTAGVTTNYMLSRELAEQHLSPRNAWVRCDDCLKWRRISVALADAIEDTNSSWSCKENMDYNFADCSVPQEKSNAEINVELELSDASGEEDENDGRRNYKQLDYSRPTVLPQSSFVLIHSNKFTHRSRRTQSIDEVMVCHCKPSLDGRLGCEDECLNRVLNIECVQGTCPCGDLCSNQQFCRRKYANMQWFRCGKKGFGLQLLDDVRTGTFIIEYVGEVLDMPTHEARQRDYAVKGHKHFYFMTLNGGEVIDASARGNLGRFINHSCDPNCRTEKWMVNGEICIGLFAIRDIKKGEEVTFDYNFVRVFGAAVKKCFCGSRHCRGYIGGDPLNSEVIVQDDSDDEFPEPEMVNEYGDILDHSDGVARPWSLDLLSGLDSVAGSKTRHKVESTIGPGSLNSVYQFSFRSLEKAVDVAETKERVESSCLLTEGAIDSEFATGTVISETQKPVSIDIDASQTTEETRLSSPRMSKQQLSNDASKVLQSDKTDGKQSSPKLRTFVKMNKSSNALCKGKESNVLSISNKVKGAGSKFVMLHTKSRRLVEGSSGGHFEAVEEKLNELLDTEGGISKRKDAAKGYLKLLFLTAASGDCVNGGAIESNRDLSMILDALLKTRSRVVLVDILSKNGLQMLHNVLKQYRRDFKKIPILRKLLKVVEYLAAREILTLEHICSGPPRPGMESFRESMLSLTEHDDKQVHQIARSFRDKYIPKSIRKICHTDKAPALLNSWRDHGIRPMEAIDCLSQSVHPSLATPSGSLPQVGIASSSIDNSPINERRVPKCKSRWDQPKDASMSLEHEKNNVGSAPLSFEPNAIDWRENSSEDIPPGFSPSVDMSRVSSNVSSTVVEVSQESDQISQVVGELQERYNPRFPVSYGIPCYILQNLGKPQAEADGWVIAPGMPFYPFPPLPQCPRVKKRSPSSSVDSQAKDILEERKQSEECCSTATVVDESTPDTSTTNSADENNCFKDQPSLKKPRVSSQDLGRKYFKQQKWNTTKVGPPWVWKRKCWGFSVRGGSGSTTLGNNVNGNRSSSFTEN